jgi:hypothetical protein
MRGSALGWLLALLALSCKQEEEPPAAYPQAQPAPAAIPAPGGVPAPTAAAPTVGVAPAPGLLCASDQDAQCPFGRCLAGRCGGCASQTDCKPNTQCVPTFVGQVCLPLVATTPAAPAPGTAPAPAPAPGSPFERARALCVTRTNEYRARVGMAPVARRPEAEACGDAQARADGQTGKAHGAFGQCRERAQNECPGWNGSPEEVIDRCLAMMFAEGPGSGPAHGHYNNMTDRKYGGVACGIAQTPSGLWVVQNFYP